MYSIYETYTTGPTRKRCILFLLLPKRNRMITTLNQEFPTPLAIPIIPANSPKKNAAFTKQVSA